MGGGGVPCVVRGGIKAGSGVLLVAGGGIGGVPGVS